MSKFETLTIVIACLSVFISFHTWRGQKKLQKESNELQKATSELAKKQLEMLASKQEAKLKLDLRQYGNGYRFFITNISEVDAENVSLDLIIDEQDPNPLSPSDIASKLPAPKLAPGSSISLLATIGSGRANSYSAVLKWTNPDGNKIEERVYTSL